MSGETIDSPTPNSYVVGVSIVEGDVPEPSPQSKGKTVTPTEPDPAPSDEPDTA
jgi:hypothetical protein